MHGLKALPCKKGAVLMEKLDGIAHFHYVALGYGRGKGGWVIGGGYAMARQQFNGSTNNFPNLAILVSYLLV